MDDLEQAFTNLNFTSGESSDSIVRAAELLAEASKTDVHVRKGLGQPLPLQQLIALIDCSLNDSIETAEVALRCVGNACIDNNIARQNVTALGFSWAQRCLTSGYHDDVATAVLATKVLYNICMDFEPAQQQCFRERIHYQLVHLLSRNDVTGHESSWLLIELFYLIASQRNAVKDGIPTHLEEGVLSKLLQLPTKNYKRLALEEYSLLLAACTTLLRAPEFEQELVNYGEALWKMFMVNEELIETLQHGGDYGIDEMDAIIASSTDMIWCLSDLAAQPATQLHENLQSDWINSLVADIKDADFTGHGMRTFIGGCQVVANVLWCAKDANALAQLNDKTSDNLETLLSLDATLFAAMVMSDDAEVLHAAAGLCLQLCRSYTVRERLAVNASLEAVLMRLCQHESPPIKQDGLKLLRAIGQGNAAIQVRFTELARAAVAGTAAANRSQGSATDATMVEG